MHTDKQVFEGICNQAVMMWKLAKQGDIETAQDFKQLFEINVEREGYSQECIDAIKVRAYDIVYKVA